MISFQRQLALLCKGVALCALMALPGRGHSVVADEIFLLKTGGQMHGKWLNRDEKPLKKYEVLTRHGARIVLDRNQVRDIEVIRPIEKEHQRLAPKVSDEPEALWELASWCRDHHLLKERKRHLQRIIHLDPEHEGARRALGYHYINGRWATLAENRKESGYEFYRGRYRLPQHIEVLEARRLRNKAQREWLSRIKQWRAQLATEDMVQARDKIAGIKDPVAVPALATLLAWERAFAAKELYIKTLYNMNNGAASQALLRASLQDPDVEVYLTCVDHIVKRPPAGAVKHYVEALRSDNNVVINRAATALARLKEKSTIGPLINALTTQHSLVYQAPGGGGPDAMTATFSPDGGGSPSPYPQSTGLSTGGGKKVITRTVPNEQVLLALISLSDGTNFSYNKDAWKTWHAARLNIAAHNDSRRETVSPSEERQ